jgi:putative endonuclease
MTTPDRMTARPPAPKRIAAYRAGLSAEAEAAACLTSKGFTILAQRHRTRYGEIDLIAQAGTLIVFVEVKARARLDDAAYAITLRQQKRIITAAQAGCELRFDAVLVVPHAPPLHLAAAFDASP